MNFILKEILNLSLLSLLGLVLCVSAQQSPNQKEESAKVLLEPEMQLRFFQNEQYKKAHARLVHDFSWIYEAKEQKQILSQDKNVVLKTLKTGKDFWRVAKARYWCAKNIDKITLDLIELLKDQTFVGLEGQADLIIWERIESKDLQFYGHGWVVPDDLFQVAGRASWMLREITGNDFGAVSMKSTPEQLNNMPNDWAEWYSKNK